MMLCAGERRSGRRLSWPWFRAPDNRAGDGLGRHPRDAGLRQPTWGRRGARVRDQQAGRAVAELTEADFELEDQGKKVPDRAFLEVDDGRRRRSRNRDRSGGLGASAVPVALRPEFSTPTGIMKARDAALRWCARAWLPQISPRWRPSASAASRSRWASLPTARSSSARSRRSASRDAGADARLLSIAYDLGVPRLGPGIGPPPSDDMNQFDRHPGKWRATTRPTTNNGSMASSTGWSSSCRRSTPVQGRKQLVLLSAGFDSSVSPARAGRRSQEASEAVVSGRIWEVQTDRYFGDSAARTSLDKLFKAVAATDTRDPHRRRHRDERARRRRGGAAAADRRGRDTLAQFAVNTAAASCRDANDLEAALASLLDASRHYYVLAFEPLDPKGKPTARGRGPRAGRRALGSHAADTRSPTRSARRPRPQAALQAAEAIAKGLSGDRSALGALAVPYRNAKGRLGLARDPAGRREALAGARSSKQLALEVFGYAFDGDGRVLDTFTVSPTLDLAAVRPALEAKGLQVITSFSVPKRPVDLRFLVREKVSRRAGSSGCGSRCRSSRRGIVLSPALAMDDPRTRLVVPAPSRGLPWLESRSASRRAAFTAEPLPRSSTAARARSA